jgi:hypothetical protein
VYINSVLRRVVGYAAYGIPGKSHARFFTCVYEYSDLINAVYIRIRYTALYGIKLKYRYTYKYVYV